MTQDTAGTHPALEVAMAALRRDLLAEGGPQISTLRNHRFAILPYLPTDELPLRSAVSTLASELRGKGWAVLSVSLRRLLRKRLAALTEADRLALVTQEKRLFARSPERALTHLQDKIALHVEGPSGIAKDVTEEIAAFAAEHRAREGKTVVFLGRVGALYPFFRSSALLKHLDGKTAGLPTVLLYPGRRTGTTELSFMDKLPPDRDYRPRIYP